MDDHSGPQWADRPSLGPNWTHHPDVPLHNLVSPASLGASTHCMAVMVDDGDRHHERAVAGAAVVYPPKNMPYGFREYAARDLESGLWSFMSAIDPEGDLI